ncbi:MAG TPA: lamin tail domain-containing protein, partial [Methylomirabilota bacterium]|nr:lamin tail domain-containing protein [Methylomirabilota bacterium]
MKRIPLLFLGLVSFIPQTRAVDSVVVFNELHYHPVTNEAASEWVELHNQMAIDIDLSAWEITGDIRYRFSEGTIIPGGGHLVIAGDPVALTAHTGITNLVGPFTGRLNNGGGTVRLRDRNGRLMDELDYRDGGKWPVAADGSGATLAKRDPNLPSGPPENWTSSVRVGGTPGARNFPADTAQQRLLIPFDALWRFEASGADLGTHWRMPGFDDSSWRGKNNATLVSYWPFDGNANATRGANGTLVGAVAAAADRNGAAGGALAFNGSLSQNVQVAGGGGLNAAAAGTISLWVKWVGNQDADCCGTFGAVLARQANGVFSDNVLALNAASPTTARVVWKQSGAGAILLTGTAPVGTNWHHIAVTFSPAGSTLFIDGVAQATAVGPALNNSPGTPLSIGAWIGDGGGFSSSFIDDVAIWDQPLSAAQIAQLAAQTVTPLAFGSPESAVYFAGDGRMITEDGLRRTLLPLGPATYYFRHTFQFADDPARTQLKLDLAVDDGAVFYLNGVEVHRHNMPRGEIGYATPAASAVGAAPLLNGIALPASALVSGTNLLAVEVHQAVAGDTGMVFGAGLAATVTPPPQGPGPEAFESGNLVFNEISAAGATTFQMELINRGPETVDAGGYILRRTGTSPDAEVALPAVAVEAGGFVVLDAAAIGFEPARGDKLFLLRPGGAAVADALEVHARPRARWPDGTGEFLTPDVVTPGASNHFEFHDQVVIHEIMYHPPPLQPEAATFSPTNTLVMLTNTWRYRADGVDLGAAWSAPDFDDSEWNAAPAMFFAPISTVNYPVPKNTFVPVTNSAGTRIITFYFRTEFIFSGDTNNLRLGLNGVIDDGAVFYLNGVEVLRYNMPATPVAYNTLASTNVNLPGFTGMLAIPASSLRPGLNTLAAELHQVSAASSDVNFAAELAAWTELTPDLPFRRSREEWIELFNRGSNAASLAGWRLDEGIDFHFGTNDSIPPGGYLVVAKDPAALRAKFPGIAVVGPYDNGLSHSGERLVLRDAADNPADIVHYYDDGRWPEAADAGGASLELRDPRADNNAGEAWAASDESGRSAWRTYSYRGLAAPSAVGPDGQWNEFVLGLLDRGVVLLDDVAVIEAPATTATNLIQNGTFETGTNKWRFIGNHHGEVIDDPDQPGNKVLRLTATGSTEHMSNHGETTLAGNRAVVNGREYLITFRARWVSGSRQLHTRLYFNRLARTTLLDAPDRHGTPGAPNTAFAPNIGPTYAGLRHDPPVPLPFSPVTVSVRAADPDGLAGLTLRWNVNGGSWSSLPMTAAAPDPSGAVEYSASLPGKAAGTVVQFYVEGADALGATSWFPAAGPASRALYKVNDGLAATNGLHNVRLVTITADADQLHRQVNLMSNERIGCTMIYDERAIFYDVGLRLKGSEHSRTTTPRLGFNLSFASEQRFRGVHDTVAIDRSESTGFGQREMLIHQTLNHAGGVPTKYHDLIQVMAPRLDHTGSAELQLARYTDVFLDDQYENGSDGTVFEYELVYQLNPPTDNGTPEGNKIPNPDSVVGTALRNLGDNKESYRWTMLIKNNEDKDDYTRIMQFCKAMELTGTNFIAQITNIIDVEAWLRGTAVNALSGAGDSYGGDGAQHNVQFYVRPEDGRVIYFPHDVDAFFDANRPIVPNSDLAKLLAVPAFARAYYGHVQDIIATTYNPTYLGRWAAHFGRLLPGQPFASHLAFIAQRVNVVNGQVNAAIPNVAFSITSSGGNNFTVSNNVVTLTGNAPLAVKEIEVNGVRYPVTWTANTAWSLRLPLYNGPNPLAVQGLDRYGVRLTNAVDSIIVTNHSGGAPLPVLINEWMADNAGPDGYADPLDGLFQDWIELFNPNTNAVNLAGFRLTDSLASPAKWTVPLGTVIAPGGFLLVWADNQPEQNAAYATNGQLHASFQLNNNGEAIALLTPEGVAQHVVVFGPQFQNVSGGLFPDGATNTVYFMTNFTPLANNTLAKRLRVTDVAFEAGTVTLTWDAIPGRNYRIEFKD